MSSLPCSVGPASLSYFECIGNIGLWFENAGGVISLLITCHRHLDSHSLPLRDPKLGMIVPHCGIERHSCLSYLGLVGNEGISGNDPQ